jgi:hypothetical protein
MYSIATKNKESKRTKKNCVLRYDRIPKYFQFPNYQELNHRFHVLSNFTLIPRNPIMNKRGRQEQFYFQAFSTASDDCQAADNYIKSNYFQFLI